MYIYGTQHRSQYRKELQIVFRRVARVKKVITFIVCQGPVKMLTAAVDACKRFFVQ